MDPRTDVETIRGELGDDDADVSDSIPRRAHSLVEHRLGDKTEDVDEEILADLETLVGAHFAIAGVTGSATGEQVKQVQQESAQVTFASAGAEGDGSGLSIWEQAVMVDPTGRLERQETEPPVVGVR